MRERLLASTMICGAAMTMLAAGQAVAQTAPAAPADTTEVEAIVVTGSLFRRTDTETPSPVTVLTSENLSRAGISTAADAIRTISADGAGSIPTGFQGGFSAGGSAVSLRGLGVSSTLVLVDGLRSANFPLNDDGHNAYVDLNSIPFSLIDRIEVLKDGASSSYGADAIGGVVNLKLKKTFVGAMGSMEAGESWHSDAGHQRADLTLGFGDYAESGWNVYINGEYQRDGRVTNHSRGFPYNNLDLTSIGGIDNNTADSSLTPTTGTPTAVVTRVSQTDLNNPLAGAAGSPFTSQYEALNLNCPDGTFTISSGPAQGTSCKYNLADKYNQIAPLQKRYAINGRVSFRVSENVEAYATGSYSRSEVSIKGQPQNTRLRQPFGAAASLASNNPGMVLPVWICSAGVNCVSAADRTLNPNNPYAAAYANDPANGAARIYYIFGDIPFASDRRNEVYRGTAGLSGSFGDDWNWRVDAVGARDNLRLVQHGYLNIANTLKAINTGSYNFVNPVANTDAVRNAIAPDITTPSHSSLMSLEGSITKSLWTLPGGDLQLALGGQIRREELENNNQNAKLDTWTLTTSSAFGKHTVSAGYFEVLAPVLNSVELNVSGRYDHYSEGYGHFSPKFGVKYTPIKQLAFRGTYAKGFRAPTFAEASPRSQYAGFSNYTPPAAFQIAHGGSTVTNGNKNPYAGQYSIGGGYNGNPDLKPEISRSFTAGAIYEPTRWLSMTVDYYNVKKSGLIVAGPLLAQARAAYYSKTNQADACAAVAAIGPGYSCNVVDGVDPLYPTALPRVLIINAPFVNANYQITSGVDFAATAKAPITDDIRLISRIEVTHVIQSDLHTADGKVQKYAGTLGPNGLSAGNGTPDWRGNWQNTLEFGDKYTLSATAYYVGKIKSVAADVYEDTSCTKGNLYNNGDQAMGEKFCYIKKFINVDLNGTAQVTDKVQLYGNIGNVFDTRAPVAPGAYTSNPNYLSAFHFPGLIGRTFKVGVRFQY